MIGNAPMVSVPMFSWLNLRIGSIAFSNEPTQGWAFEGMIDLFGLKDLKVNIASQTEIDDGPQADLEYLTNIEQFIHYDILEDFEGNADACCVALSYGTW